MTTTVSASLSVQMQAQKTISTGDPTLPNVSYPLNLQQPSMAWSASSNPNILDTWSATIAMSAGAANIDLTSLTQAGLSATLNQTGNKLRAFQILAPATNAAAIQIAPGGSNGYSSIGTVSALSPGDACVKTTGSAIAVDSTHKNIAITGTGTDSIEILMFFGS